MEGLNNVARDLYNAFNADDHNSDKLAELHLPLHGGDRILVERRGAPGERLDALQVLSEGHIRCLGLAILLAKNIQLDLPLIIFDDAVNAIDHDHRRGIREVLFGDPLFSHKQIVVTCHSNEFIKDIQNNIPRNTSKLYVINNHDGDNHPLVNGNATSRNYLEIAEANLRDLNDRDALASSRRALETLTNELWRQLEGVHAGLIKVRMFRRNAPPELRSVLEQLRKKVDDGAFGEPKRGAILAAVDELLGISAQNLAWLYLNKGTHEEIDRDDFDHAEVISVVRSLTELDRAIS